MPATIDVPAAAPSSDNLLEDAGLFTKQQIAKGIHVSSRTLDRLHAKRLGPPRVHVGRRILYRKAAVLEWLGQQEEIPAARTRRRKTTTA